MTSWEADCHVLWLYILYRTNLLHGVVDLTGVVVSISIIVVNGIVAISYEYDLKLFKVWMFSNNLLNALKYVKEIISTVRIQFGYFLFVLFLCRRCEFSFNCVMVSHCNELLESRLIALKVTISKLHASFLQWYHGPAAHWTTDVETLEQNFIFSWLGNLLHLTIAKNELIVIYLTHSYLILDVRLFFWNREVLGNDCLSFWACRRHLDHLLFCLWRRWLFFSLLLFVLLLVLSHVFIWVFLILHKA